VADTLLRSTPVAQTVALPPANPVAVAKMVQGVQAAKDGAARSRHRALPRKPSLDSNLWEARYDLGVVLAGAGDLAGAEDQLSTAAKLAPDSQEIAQALAETRRRRGSRRPPPTGWPTSCRTTPTPSTRARSIVAALRESGQIDKAIAEAREVLVRKPSDATALAELALSHLAKGEKEAAALLAKQALDSNPNSAVAHRATGLLDLANGDDAEAFAEFRKASQADPKDTTSRLNMGVVLLKAGAYPKAEEQYRQILAVNADDVEAQVGLAAALRGEADAQHPQKLEEARALLDKVLQADSHNTSAEFNMGVLLADFLKRPGDAAPYFKRFESDAPGDSPLRADADKYISAASASAPPPPAPASPTPAPATPPAPPGPPPAKK
jgi:tetratricopeptide (TPR) repeat protein